MSRKVVFITGTNSGFGWLTAKAVAALGHKVYATMRDTDGKNADKAKALSQVENMGGLLRPFPQCTGPQNSLWRD